MVRYVRCRRCCKITAAVRDDGSYVQFLVLDDEGCKRSQGLWNGRQLSLTPSLSGGTTEWMDGPFTSVISGNCDTRPFSVPRRPPCASTRSADIFSICDVRTEAGTDHRIGHGYGYACLRRSTGLAIASDADAAQLENPSFLVLHAFPFVRSLLSCTFYLLLCSLEIGRLYRT